MRFKNIFVIGKYLYKQRLSIKPSYGCEAVIRRTSDNKYFIVGTCSVFQSCVSLHYE